MDYKAACECERKIYEPWNIVKKVINRFQENERCAIFRYLKYLRTEEFFLSKGPAYKLFRILYTRKKNVLGNRIGLKIVAGYVQKGINIHHRNIIINGYVGENCIFHGNNCIGNNTMGGKSNTEIPRVGNNVEFGYGACVIGGVTIANNVKIGAGSLVIKDILEENSIWVGVPAKKLIK